MLFRSDGVNAPGHGFKRHFVFVARGRNLRAQAIDGDGGDKAAVRAHPHAQAAAAAGGVDEAWRDVGSGVVTMR